MLTGRALPLAGLGTAIADTAFSDNPWRTGTGNAFGVVGGGLGAALLSPSVAGTIAGGLGGSYLGNELGLGLYVGGLGHPSASNTEVIHLKVLYALAISIGIYGLLMIIAYPINRRMKAERSHITLEVFSQDLRDPSYEPEAIKAAYEDIIAAR